MGYQWLEIRLKAIDQPNARTDRRYRFPHLFRPPPSRHALKEAADPLSQRVLLISLDR